MESQEEPVLDPVTHLPVEDPTLAQAIREGNHWITKRGKPRTVVSWRKFMQSRRTYLGIPRYFGLTDREVQTYMKITREALVPIQIIGRVWGHHALKTIMEFIRAKDIPVYRWPAAKGAMGYYVFSGDIVRAIESCRLDLKADGEAWVKYMIREDRLWHKRKAKEYARKAERLRQDLVDPDQDRADAGRGAAVGSAKG